MHSVNLLGTDENTNILVKCIHKEASNDKRQAKEANCRGKQLPETRIRVNWGKEAAHTSWNPTPQPSPRNSPL